ncbi:hypothetical protein [Pseudogemmobacter faecipullorum]|uniref:DUF4376 domain-containing protein n=1 Tax=Pseudogemmobacter faecipullorum TaxID=2755041 RepID=A0ABS8CQ30_9RHOB|nr:hypothetical protein [Pseudogemmobacter faecipullorum]MCB5411512.1 hypothetical protein [Pseudogemmobacter faecipullorum]
MSETQDNRWSWWVGSDDERFHTECQTREEAETIAKRDGGAWVCHALSGGNLKASDSLDIERLIEDIDQNMIENFGNEDGDPIFELNAEQEKSLEAALKAALDKWQEENGVICKAWQFQDCDPAFYVETTP